ncbi:eCIS core domain-containing protein [Pseudobacteriovorax antillogorgiicola]|uniref:eCIS core domain-containing protein n=1 Tax=Pseudobacteriovorax antillogorgiicola TaxID=1513793 RepID=A0A1Y6CP71_9BACT|nr:DUF4157 domain-containing protein [Pseudobacteriovorax antillogorgiicola]TCS47346.1 uncharacterized protein DUF4157 [Pseudobacteriovorax antillogorgiicola]SMF63203.1 protein of unknown function [Pseudobacteriovorax antillogorgiicola]
MLVLRKPGFLTKIILFSISLCLVACQETGYQSHLDSQVSEWEQIDPDLLTSVTNCTGQDFSFVRYATGIDTMHGLAITINHKIYFTKDTLSKKTLFHELMHVLHWQRGDFELSYGAAQTVGFLQGALLFESPAGHRHSFYEKEAREFSARVLDCMQFENS